MLKSLTIKNFALISELSLEPAEGLSVITGETGAGKSILLGALGLILGERADTTAILNKAEKCTVEALFDISPYPLQSFFEENDLDYDPQTIIRREVAPNGKSRSFINDTPVTLQELKELGSFLVDIHTQNTSSNLQSVTYQLHVLDAYSENNALSAQYALQYRQFKRIQQSIKEIEEKETVLNHQQEFNTFQFEELEKANIEEDEEKKLESRIDLLENAGEIGQNCLQANDVLTESQINVLDLINTTKALLKNPAAKHSGIAELLEQLNRISVELKDISQTLKKTSEQTEANPAELEQVNQRFLMLQNLFRKHRVDGSSGLIEIRNRLSDELYSINNMGHEKAELQKQMQVILEDLKTTGTGLSEKRTAAAVKMAEKIKALLTELEMPQSDFAIQITTNETNEPQPTGFDSIEFRFSANGGMLQNMSKVASGGEISRLMFALKCVIAGKTNLPTLIFDEIDSGISGEAATKMGMMMETLANNHQVITVTHLAQIASMGTKHFYVFKKSGNQQVESAIRTLDTNERVIEIAKMISGNNPMESALEHARKLVLK